MKQPLNAFCFRGRLKLAVGIGLILAGFCAAVLEYRAGYGGTALLEVPLTVADFADAYETPAVEAPAGLVFKTRVSALVDNSWISVRASALDSAGQIVDECDWKLEYYHGFHEGKPYRAGSQFAGGFLRVFSPGSYRFRIQVTAGQGDSAVPQTMQAGKPLPFVIPHGGGHGPQWRLAGFMTATVAGLAVLLSAMADLCRLKRNRVVTEKEGDPATPGIFGPKGSDRMILLDGLRGVACLSVVACHFLLPGISQIAPAAQDALPTGKFQFQWSFPKIHEFKIAAK